MSSGNGSGGEEGEDARTRGRQAASGGYPETRKEGEAASGGGRQAEQRDDDEEDQREHVISDAADKQSRPVRVKSVCSMESVLSHETGISGAMTPLFHSDGKRDALSKIDNESLSFDGSPSISCPRRPLPLSPFPAADSYTLLMQTFHHDTHLLLPCLPPHT